jgi:hypothetical protein
MHEKLNSLLSDGFVEALWETMIALAMAAGICVGVVSLAAYLNETQAVRSAGEPAVVASPLAAATPDLSAPNSTDFN